LVGYCSSNRLSTSPATNIVITTTTQAEIYCEDTKEYSTAIILGAKGCPGDECVKSATRAFKVDHSCDPVDSFSCICANDGFLNTARKYIQMWSNSLR
jgi:hypothetical protein